MTELLSVRQASKHAGKSESTIKRMIREIADDPKHEDRGLVEPSHADLEEKKRNGEPYYWKVSKELLDKRYPVNDRDHARGQNAGYGRGDSGMIAPGQTQLIELLQTQLDSKDAQLKTLETQLDRKDEQISHLNERLREGNVLMQTLQKHFNLPVPEEGESVEAAAAKRVQDAEVIVQPAPAPVEKKKKRRTLKEILHSPVFRK